MGWRRQGGRQGERNARSQRRRSGPQHEYSHSETTASTSGLAIVLMLAAGVGCHCVTADVGCAYLNTSMPKDDPNELVFIKIAADIAATLSAVNPKMRVYIRADGSLSNTIKPSMGASSRRSCGIHRSYQYPQEAWIQSQWHRPMYR